jgi:glycosyltransferase involved in cell wall biosynthesis
MYFSKYISEFGIEPVVLTVKDKQASYSSLDESLLKEVSHIRTFKTSTLEPIRLYSFLKSGSSKTNIPQGNVGGKKPGVMDKLARHIRANYFIPDARVGWNPYAYKKAKNLLQLEKFDWVITTGPPQSTHLIGLKLKRELGVCWLADFRDPWTEVYYNELFKRTRKNEQKDKALELAVLKEADSILTVGPSMKRLLETKIPDQKDKIAYIFNGFDKVKLEQAPTLHHERFTLAYVGTLSANYPYKTLVEGIKLLLLTCKISIQLNLAGKLEADVLQDFKNLENEIFNVNYLGIIPHQAALSQMKSADVLLVCLPIYEGSNIFVSGKLMEYIACKKPIVGILQKESDAAFLIENYATGAVFHENEAQAVADRLLFHLQNQHPAEIKNNPADFERRNTAKLVSELLKK